MTIYNCTLITDINMSHTVKKVRKFYRCFTSILYELQKLTTGNFVYVSFT